MKTETRNLILALNDVRDLSLAKQLVGKAELLADKLAGTDDARKLLVAIENVRRYFARQ